MSDENASVTPTLSTKLVGILVALVTTMVTVPATYLIKEYLARDRISIEAVEIIPIMTTYEVEADKFRALTQDPGEFYRTEFNIWLDGQIQPTISFFRERQSLAFNDTERTTLIAALEGFVNFVEQRLAQVRGYQMRWGNVQTAKEVDQVRLRTLIEEAGLLRVMVLPGPAALVQPPLEQIDEEVKRKVVSLETIKQLVTAIVASAREFRPERTGDISILVTILNAGNTDGLMKADGELEIVSRSERIPIVEYNGKAQKIEKRSVTEVWFRFNEGNAAREQLVSMKALVRNKASISGIITLKDFRNSTMRSSGSAFPVTESNPPATSGRVSNP
jgi:hypothetical protein